MVRQLLLCLVPAFANVDPLELHKQHLHGVLSKHGVQPDAVNTMVDMWAAEERDRPLENWAREDWSEHHHPSYMHKDGYKVEKVTYTSPSVKLKTGEAHFTINTATHAPYPKGDYSLLANQFRVIEASSPNVSVGLGEVYLHHWLMGGLTDPNPLDYCEDDYYWGYGAEMNGMTYDIPKGYAQKRIGASGHCGLNIHFIRVEDLATEWKGFNNPAGSWGAAVKNCAECGWAPKRATECLEPLDGTFACCFTYSRCPVNKYSDRSHKEYKLQYDVEYTLDLVTPKAARVGVLDVSGGAIEWNIKPNGNAPKTVCDDKTCVTKDQWTAGTTRGFGTGICSGEMLWSYTHQHVGAINSTMLVNGKPYCTSYPIHGTDPSNPVGNEKGFVVKFTECVHKFKLNNSFRLNEGDVVRLESWYDVDPDSTATLPLPGGKHGGVMDLFFTFMDCDPGTYGEIYVCRQDACIPTFRGHASSSETFATKGDCETTCGKKALSV